VILICCDGVSLQVHPPGTQLMVVAILSTNALPSTLGFFLME
jgi:hypothetical protein